MSEKRGRYAIRNEADNGLTNRRGTIAMARDPLAIDSSTCQFFVNLADNPALDHRGDTPESFGFCVFGEVIEGMDVVDKIGQSPVRDTSEFSQLPTRTVLIETARRKR
jgi:peptidyl-prolyl cis-trans isomerase A (cyclophilin A)/peptidyl-prolyl cis-trans isomerase B (cyclophilin B)